MQFYNYQSPRESSGKSDTLVQNLQTAIKAFQKEVSRNNLIHADSNYVQEILTAFSDILEDGFERTTDGEPSHYWPTISSFLDTTPMKFVNSLENFETDSDKAIVWLLIELKNKNLCNILTEILQIPRIMKYYSSSSVIHSKAAEVKDICKVLTRLDYTVESKFLKIYEENRDDFEDQSFTSSVLVRESCADWTRSLIREKTGSQLFSDTPSLRNQFSIREQQIDNISQIDKVDFSMSMTTSSQTNSLQRSTTNVNSVKQNLERYKTLLGRPTLNGEEEDDSHTFVRENYKKDLEERSKKTQLGNPLGFITKVLDPVNKLISEAPKKMLRKSSSYGDLTSKIKEEFTSSDDNNKGYGTQSGNKAKLPRKSSCEFQMAPAPQFDLRNDLNPFEYHKQETKRMAQAYHSSEQEQDDNYESALGAYTASELRNMKNSKLLYIQKYQRLQAQFEYRAAPATVITPDQQGGKCFDCGCELNKLLLKIWPKKSYCNYTGYYYCNACMGKEKHLIPWYARDNFDFKLYHVCRKGREELKRFYDKPTLMLDHKEKVVLENKVLYDALVMKRQLHLMFDMICESPYVLDLLGANANLLLKENLFSLKNLSEIHSGAMQRYMEKCFEMLKSHVSGCSICQNKGKICPSCSDKKKLFAFDIKNTSVCRTCKYIYHTRCLKLKKCIVCQHNS